MKLALFSDNLTNQHIEKLRRFFNKNLSEVSLLYITTPTNYKPFKPEWCVSAERRLLSIFPLFREFDLERAFKVDPSFNFSEYLSNFEFIFVSGGNTFILSYWMRKTGAGDFIQRKVKEDKLVYGGESAGAVYAYKDISLFAPLDEPEKAPEIVNEGLGLVNFAPLPHWKNEKFHTGLEKIKNEFEKNQVKVVTLTDDQAIFVRDDKVDVI